jgi:branched-chain amino acid transport system permease protein
MTLAIESSKTLVHYRFSTYELIPLAVAIVFYYALPDYLPVGSAICVTAIFALSLDLVVGYAGIVTLGHSVFFGIGAYTAALLSKQGWGEPISAVITGAVVSAFFALVSGPLLLRLRGLPLIMVTLGVASVISEAANKLSWLTGGNDGLPGLTFDPVFKIFPWSIDGRTAYLYALAWLILVLIVARTVVSSSFGVALQGIRQNELRMRLIGAPVLGQLVVAYALSAGIAGVAGALYAQSNGFVGLEALSVDQGVFGLAMIVLGGIGRLYGAIVGAAVYMVVQYAAQQWDPYYWMLAIGIMLVLVVRFSRGGILGALDVVWAELTRRLEAHR